MRALATAAVAAVCLTGAAATAQDDEPWMLTLQIENDIFAGVDEQYTNGSYLVLTQPANDLPGWARWTRRQLDGLIDAPRWQASYGLGQAMFTPGDIEDPDPPLDDRPYAGFLFGSLVLTADAGDRLDTIGLDVGVTGPPSLAESAQKFIHNDLGIGDTPRGWDTQLETELAFRAYYERKWRRGMTLGPEWRGLEVDAIPQATVALGTLDVSLAGAVAVRLGQGLDIDYGPPRVRRSVAPVLRPAAGEAMRWHVFAGGGVTLVGRDLFLDGNTFRDSRSVERERLLGDLNLGFTVEFERAVLSYTHVFRTPAFQDRRYGTQFGSLSLRIPF